MCRNFIEENALKISTLYALDHPLKIDNSTNYALCKLNTETITLEFIANAIETAYIENFIDEEYRNRLTFDIEHLSKFLCEYFDKDFNEEAQERFIEISKKLMPN